MTLAAVSVSAVGVAVAADHLQSNNRSPSLEVTRLPLGSILEGALKALVALSSPSFRPQPLVSRRQPLFHVQLHVRQQQPTVLSTLALLPEEVRCAVERPPAPLVVPPLQQVASAHP